MPGSLTIAGLGIAGLDHITRETVRYIREADSIYYLTNTNDTQLADFIRETRNKEDPTEDAKNIHDLTPAYQRGIFRYQIYCDIARTMVDAIGGRYNVLGLFYGHPGFFVSPSHQALALAKKEHTVRMLPGVSSVDYLMADLWSEPARYGLMIHEANDLLARNRTIDNSVHNVILQVGGVGDTTAEIRNKKFDLLVERLKRDFSEEHKLLYYVGGVTPSESAWKQWSIDELLVHWRASEIGMTGTFYIPPLKIPGPDQEMMARLEFGENVKKILDRVPDWDDNKRWVLPPFEGNFVPEATQLSDQPDDTPPPVSTIGVAI